MSFPRTLRDRNLAMMKARSPYTRRNEPMEKNFMFRHFNKFFAATAIVTALIFVMAIVFVILFLTGNLDLSYSYSYNYQVGGVEYQESYNLGQ
jgi:hypothetical protein